MLGVATRVQLAYTALSPGRPGVETGTGLGAPTR